jgi:hypothetical protein
VFQYFFPYLDFIEFSYANLHKFLNTMSLLYFNSDLLDSFNRPLYSILYLTIVLTGREIEDGSYI